MPATAQAGQTPFSSLSPPDEASYQEGTDIIFEMTASGDFGVPVIEISRQPTLGQDGTLADDFKVDTLYMGRSDAAPNHYMTRAGTPSFPHEWVKTPGRYYWQIYTNYGADSGPIRTIVITPAPPPPPPQDRDCHYFRYQEDVGDYIRAENVPAHVFTAVLGWDANGNGVLCDTLPHRPLPVTPATASPVALTKAQALSYLRRVIRTLSGHRAYRLRRQCDRVDSETFNCAVSWWSSRRGIRGTYYTGDIELTDAGTRVRYRFDGRKATAKCIKRRSIKRCLRRAR